MNPDLYLPSLALAWHPVHETILASGGSEGAILMWDVGYVIRLRARAKHRRAPTHPAHYGSAVCWAQCPGTAAVARHRARVQRVELDVASHRPHSLVRGALHRAARVSHKLTTFSHIRRTC